MIRKRLAPLAFLVAGLLLGTALTNVVYPHPASAQSMKAMTRGQMSRADTEMMRAMQAMNDQMHALKLTGNTDRDFMLMMIPHHRAAVSMAQVELHYGKSDMVKDLAKSISTSQRKESAQMKSWLAESF